MSETPRLSITEYSVLGLLAETPTHGFALSKELEADGALGRVFTVRRPLVYRALDRLVDVGLAEPVTTEQAGGPKRTIHRVTPRGHRRVRAWLSQPVEHIRDLRLEFLLKLALLRRSGRSPVGLIRMQRETLEATLNALDDPIDDTDDPVELWRRHIAAAAAAYLEDLDELYGITGN